MKKITPNDLRVQPMSSVTKNSESETIAMNIMIILGSNGNEFRKLSYSEYKQRRLDDGNFSESEKIFFDRVIEYTLSLESAALFSNVWKEIINEGLNHD